MYNSVNKNVTANPSDHISYEWLKNIMCIEYWKMWAWVGMNGLKLNRKVTVEHLNAHFVILTHLQKMDGGKERI